MIRTQVQLTEKQVEMLKELARRENVSMAELIRRAVERWLQEASPISLGERKRRALDIVGRFRSGRADVSDKHDEYLAEISGGRPF